jgi:hypothetical protein
LEGCDHLVVYGGHSSRPCKPPCSAAQPSLLHILDGCHCLGCHAITRLGPRPVDSGIPLQSSLESLFESRGNSRLGQGEDVEEGVVTRLSQEGFSKALHTSSKHPSCGSRQRLVHSGQTGHVPGQFGVQDSRSSVLGSVAREKGRRHPPSDRPFPPLVLSLGDRMVETEARDAVKLRKSAMTGGVYSLLSSPSAC